MAYISVGAASIGGVFDRFDRWHTYDPSALYHSGRYYMYYSGTHRDSKPGPLAPGANGIGYATRATLNFDHESSYAGGFNILGYEASVNGVTILGGDGAAPIVFGRSQPSVSQIAAEATSLWLVRGANDTERFPLVSTGWLNCNDGPGVAKNLDGSALKAGVDLRLRVFNSVGAEPNSNWRIERIADFNKPAGDFPAFTP